LPKVDWQNLIGGLALVAIGGFFVWGALGMRIGTAARMGPGYFPLLIGAISMGVGALIAVSGFFRSSSVPVPSWRPTVAVLAGVLAFGLAMRSFGLLVAIAACVLVSALADRNSHPLGALALAACLAVASWAIFVRGLGLAMPVWRMPF
jgi:hypothetical protein